jgi:hypothetical protein
MGDKDDKQTAELVHELKIIAKLPASNIMEGKSLTEKALTLSSLGLETGDIAEILGKDSGLISQTLYQAKKTKGNKSKEAVEDSEKKLPKFRVEASGGFLRREHADSG